MKFLITGYKDKQEKEEIKKQGLYCYDLRHSDDGTEIATIEKSVLVNRIGSIITNEELAFDTYDFIDFEKYSLENTQIDTIEQLLNSKNIQTIQKCKLIKDYNNEYPYNVQIWNNIGGSNKFFYSGNGKFFKTEKEAEIYIKELEKKGIKREKNKEREAR